MPLEAMAIYQDFLDRTSDALISGDAKGFLRHVHLPHQIVTENGIIEVADMTAAQRHFDGFVGALRAAGADSYVRTAQSAAFIAQDRILGRHMAHITSGGKLVTPAFENKMEMELRDGVWGMSWVLHRVHAVGWPDILPREENE
jgi:hypothetical protein